MTITNRRARYLRAWDCPVLGPELHEKHGGNFKEYFLAHRKDEEAMALEEECMECFIKWERRLLRTFLTKLRYRPYELAGQDALGALKSAIRARQLTPEADFVIASIDFEGHAASRGCVHIHGYGAALLDTRDLLRPDLDRDGTDIALSACNFRSDCDNSGFLYGPTQCIEREDIKDVVLKSLRIEHFGSSAPRRVILLAHGLHSDLSSLSHLGICLEEDLPQVFATINTDHLVREETGARQLGEVLVALRIPHRGRMLHCAGNDAVLTMQVLLAWLCGQMSDAPKELKELAYRNAPYIDGGEIGHWEKWLDDSGLGLEFDEE